MKYLIYSIIALLTVIFSHLVQAEPWTKEQKQLAAISTTLHFIDWGQTRHIAKNPDRFYERSPLLPNHPSMGQVNRHFIISGIIIASAAHFLPQYRSQLLKIHIGYQTINTVRNFHIGLKGDF